MNGSSSSLAIGCCLALKPTDDAFALRRPALYLVIGALEAANWKAADAAPILGVSLRTLNDWRKAYPELGKPEVTKWRRRKSTG